MVEIVLLASELRKTKEPKHFSCRATMIVSMGGFPQMMKTDLGNKEPLYFNRSIFNEDGCFVGAVYQQSGGCEVSVFLA